MKHPQIGEGLVEVVVVLLLLSTAVAGLTGTVLKAQQLSQTSIQQSKISFLVASLANNIRSNTDQAPTEISLYLASGSEQNQFPKSCPINSWCSSKRLAQQHLGEFHRQLVRHLGIFYFTICRDLSPYDGTSTNHQCDRHSASPLAIKIWWESRGMRDSFKMRLSQ